MQPIRGVARRFRNGWKAVRKGLDHSALEALTFQSGLGDSAYLLYGLVRAAKPKVVVEIGSARGRSTCFMGMALKENGSGQLFAIDPHTRNDWNDEHLTDTYGLLTHNVRRLRLEKQIEILRDTSDNVAGHWNLAIDILFIDGDHSYEGVKRDWKKFSPFVNPFGGVIFHDTLWELRPDPKYLRADMGVPRFVEELRGEGYPVITLDRDFGVSMVQPVRSGVSLQGTDPKALPHRKGA